LYFGRSVVTGVVAIWFRDEQVSSVRGDELPFLLLEFVDVLIPSFICSWVEKQLRG
jgi:hypothetical protein